MNDLAYLEQHPRAHADSTAAKCGGTPDCSCDEPAAWRLARPWGGHTLNGYCPRHAVRLALADEHANQLHDQAVKRRALNKMEGRT